MAEKELFKLFDYQFREEFHFEYSSGYSEKDENKAKQLIKTEIKNLLFEYSPSKVYCILYQGVKKAVTHKQKYGMTHYRDNQVQFVISYGIKSWLKYNEERISDYDYPWTSEMSLVSTLFFKNILQNDEWFYNLIPIDKVEIIEQDLYHELQPYLQQVGDMERILARVALRSARPRDLTRLRTALEQIEPIKSLIHTKISSNLTALSTQIGDFSAQIELLQKANY